MKVDSKSNTTDYYGGSAEEKPTASSRGVNHQFHHNILCWFCGRYYICQYNKVYHNKMNQVFATDCWQYYADNVMYTFNTISTRNHFKIKYKKEMTKNKKECSRQLHDKQLCRNYQLCCRVFNPISSIQTDQINFWVKHAHIRHSLMPINNLCLYLDLVIGCIQVLLQGSDLIFQLLYHSWRTHKTMGGMEMKQTQYKAIQKLFLCFWRKSQLKHHSNWSTQYLTTWKWDLPIN